jgi:hypothetical protein
MTFDDQQAGFSVSELAAACKVGRDRCQHECAGCEPFVTAAPFPCDEAASEDQLCDLSEALEKVSATISKLTKLYPQSLQWGD